MAAKPIDQKCLPSYAAKRKATFMIKGGSESSHKRKEMQIVGSDKARRKTLLTPVMLPEDMLRAQHQYTGAHH